MLLDFRNSELNKKHVPWRILAFLTPEWQPSVPPVSSGEKFLAFCRENLLFSSVFDIFSRPTTKHNALHPKLVTGEHADPTLGETQICYNMQS